MEQANWARKGMVFLSFFVFPWFISANLSTVSLEGEESVFERASGVRGATRGMMLAITILAGYPSRDGESSSCCTLWPIHS